MLFFLMIRRPPRSTLFPLHDALPISMSPSSSFDQYFSCAPYTTRVGAPHLRISSLRSCAISNSSMAPRSEEHTSELQSRQYLVCRLLLEKKIQRHYLLAIS